MRSSRRHHRVVIMSTTVIVAVTAAACTGGATQATSPRTPAGFARHPSPITANLLPATTMYYLGRNRPRRADGTVYERRLHSNVPAGHALGRGTDIQVTPGAAPGAVGTVQWFSSRTGRETLTAPGEPAATLQEHPMPHGEAADQSLCALAFDGRYYRQRGNDVVAISGHRIVARYRLPALRPEPWAVRTTVARHERPGVGMVGALVPMPSGHVLAFSFVGVAAAVTDLMTGRSTAIPGSGDVESAVRTASGDLYVVVDRSTDRGIDGEGWTSPDVVRLDPTTFRVIARMPTGAPRHQLLRIAGLLPGVGHDAVLAVLATGGGIANPPLRVWTVDGNRLTAVRAIRRGLALAPDDAHHVFVYSDKGVGVLDIATGAYRPNVRRLDPPPGSSIEAIL